MLLGREDSLGDGATTTQKTSWDVFVALYRPSILKGNIMLVLSRQRDESIIIGENIVITVVDIRGDKVRLGIQAPTEIPVHRQEVYKAIQREKEVAEAGGSPPS